MLHGESGSIRAGTESYELLSEGEDPSPRPYRLPKLSSYALEFQVFVDYLGGDESAPMIGYSERKTLAVIQAGAESSDSGEGIDIKECFVSL